MFNIDNDEKEYKMELSASTVAFISCSPAMSTNSSQVDVALFPSL